MTAAILADVWKTTPYMALLLLAGLQIIDRGLYEAQKLTARGRYGRFFSITLPLLKPSLLVALLFRTLDAFRVYDLIAVLTGGRAGNRNLSIYAYKLMIAQNNYGYGAVVRAGHGRSALRLSRFCLSKCLARKSSGTIEEKHEKQEKIDDKSRIDRIIAAFLGGDGFPFFWILITSFKPSSEIFGKDPAFNIIANNPPADELSGGAQQGNSQLG